MTSKSELNAAIAIIGMSARYPGARDVQTLWKNVCNGTSSITRFTDADLLATGVSPAMLARPAYVRAAGVVDDIELFDAAFFGINPREAELMDPQHTLFLEHAWDALESSGYLGDATTTRVGVFAGISISTYLIYNLLSHPDMLETAGGLLVKHTNDKDYVATRVSYKLNLRGPSMTVQTGCSTSLVATHLACQSLLEGECDIAIAGGATINVPQCRGYLYQEGGIASPDGKCRPFDAKASGTVLTGGVGVVVLKRLSAAIVDGDHIHAVIRGTAVNNDGSAKVGFTAPGVEGQAAVIREAMAIAGVEARDISYIHAHGTGTHLGDPIEIAALSQAFGPGIRGARCAIGSVKANIGHANTAAGVAGLMTTALALEHRLLPPMANFESPNPVIPLPIALLHPADAGTLAVGRRAPHRGCQLIWDGWHERACGARGAAAPSDQRFHTGRQPPACFGQNSGRSRSGDNAPRRLALESPRGVTRRRRLHASGRPASLPSSPVRGLSFRRGGRRRTPPALGEASRLASTKPASAPLPSCSRAGCAIRRDGTRPIRTGT